MAIEKVFVMRILIILLLLFFCTDLNAMEDSGQALSHYYQNVEDYFHGLPGSSKTTSKTTKICIIITECNQKLKESEKKKPGF
jgi:hypothetical protein